MSQTQHIIINLKGGIVSPGYLNEILTIADSSQVSHASFGLRQQLLMDVPLQHFENFKNQCAAKNITFHENGDERPNIVSSYGAANIFSQESWLSEGVYKDVFDLFNYEPRLKINICDSNQNLVPFFTGHLNWISSPHVHFWYLYLRLPESEKLFCWPELIYTNDIEKVSSTICRYISDHKEYHNGNKQVDLQSLVPRVKQLISYISKPVMEQMNIPTFQLPYYEGFNKEGDVYWLGIYKRDELFLIDFLKDICNICLQTKIGEFYTTPWKSIIIKGIKNENRNLWNHVLGKYRINVRHAANELNWQVEDGNEDGLIIKRHIIRHFDKEDVRTFGLCFAVKTKPSSNMFGAVIISKQQIKRTNRLKSMDRFDILYKKDFKPNSTELVLHRKGVKKDQIGTYLVSLCKHFYEQESSNIPLANDGGFISNEASTESMQSTIFYQCRQCLSVYDEKAADTGNQIEAGIPFNELPDFYKCPLCEAGKEEFIAVEERTLMHVHQA